MPTFSKFPFDEALAPVATLLVAGAVVDADARVLLTVAVPTAAATAVARRLPRGYGSAVLVLLGILALGAGAIAREPLLLAASALYLTAGVRRAWGLNRGRSRRRAWRYRALTAVGAVVAGLWIVVPVLQATNYLAKPRAPISDAALGLPHEDVSFAATDGVRLAGWYVPSRNGAAVVLVHGGGGDREGAVRHARMLAAGGYGVLLYDSRGRGESGGHANAFGWRWHRDVRGAVDFLERRGVERIGAFGISTGAEAVLTEAADDPRVGAVVGDGAQARTVADMDDSSPAMRVFFQPQGAVVEVAIGAVRGERPPRPLRDVVRVTAATRPVLLISGPDFELDMNRAQADGTSAQVWQVEGSTHTRGLTDRPAEYARRVLRVFDEALLDADERT